MVHSNEGWPESFGFSIAGDAPVVVVSVLANSVAESAGLHVGDQILEINDKNVQGLSKEQVIIVARRSSRVPPSLAVISRIRTFRLQRRRRDGFGFTLRDSRPVHIENVFKSSPAYEAGICNGDMIIQVNGQSVKRLSKNEVYKLIERSGSSVKLKLIAGNSAIKRFDDKYSSKTFSSHKKARELFQQMNYYLTGEEHKKTLLIALMKRYAKDRDIERFSRLVSSLLSSTIQRRLLKPIRYFIPNRHKPYFDAIVNQNYANGSSIELTTPRFGDRRSSPRQKENQLDFDIPTPRSMTWSRNTSTPYTGQEKRSSSFSKMLEKSKRHERPKRLVHLERESGQGPFGFTITGYNPVFLRSVDEGGPAEAAGLKPGDCILEINGINVSQANHDSVIELLRNSGTSPTLLVQWHPVPKGLRNGVSPIRSDLHANGQSANQQQNGENSGSDSALESDISPRNETGNDKDAVHPEPDQNALLRHLKEQMKKLLTRGEQLVVRQALSDYYKDRDIQKLINALEPVLDDPLKLQMLHCISRLLPPTAQLEFEQLAVEMVSRQMENGIIISASTTPHEMFDILFRVQGSKLSDVDRPRSLIGGLVDVKTDSTSSLKQVSGSNSTGSLGSDPDPTARKKNTYEEIHDIAPVGDSTVDALMAIDDSQLMSSPNTSGNSRIIATAIVHSQPKKEQLKDHIDLNNNGQQGAKKIDSIESENSDDAFEDEEANDDRAKLTQKDIDDLKSELKKAQEEVRKARLEAEEEKQKLEPIQEGATLAAPGPSSQSMTKPAKDIGEEIKEKSFQMEPERLRSVSTDDHVILPGQYMPPPPPPPPMAPAPPPPPPPPSAGAPNTMQLKRINWEKLSGVAIENTVWGKIGSEDEVDDMIDFKELETLFSTKHLPKKEKNTEKKQQTSILESKKTYNLSILLGHLKMPNDEIYKAVLAVDESKLTEPHIKTMQMCAPDRTEIEQFRAFNDDLKAMSTADSFTAKMLTMPNYNERLRAMLFKARFYDRLDEILPDIESVSLASDEVMSSKKLMKILEIVLATGNYMNQGSSRMSGASGFKISFLTKLISTRTSDNKSTLLHVIVNSIKNNKSELLDVKEELSNVPQAAKVSSQMLSLEIGELRTGMKEIQDELKNYQTTELDDKYQQVIGQFVKNAERQFKDLLDAYEKMINTFKQAAEFYSESHITTEDFFGAFAIFLQNFESVKKDVMSEEERREYYARKEKELEEMRKRRGSSVIRSRTQSLDASLAMQPVPENEVMKGFEAILKKRFENDGTEIEDDKIDAPVGENDKAKGTAEGEETENAKLTIRRISEDNSSRKVEVMASSPRKESSSSDDVAKHPSPPIRPNVWLSQSSPDDDAFAALLKRRQIIEGTESERERTESSSSEWSVFSTLPRVKAKPPPPGAPSKKKAPPPPLKPKPKPGGADFKSATLPRSASNAVKQVGSEVGKTKPVLKSSISAPSERSELEQKLAKVSASFNDVGVSSKKTESVDLDVTGRAKMENIGMKDKDTEGKRLGQECDKLEEKKEKSTPENETAKFIADNVSSQNLKKSNEVLVNVGMRLPRYKVEVNFAQQRKPQDDKTQVELRQRAGSVDAPKKPTRIINNKITIKPFQPNDAANDYDHDDNDYDNLPSDKVHTSNNSTQEDTVSIVKAPNYPRKDYDHDDNDYDNLPSDKVHTSNNSTQEATVGIIKAPNFPPKDYDHDDNDYDNLPSDKGHAGTTTQEAAVGVLREPNLPRIDYDHDDNDYDNLPPGKIQEDDDTTQKTVPDLLNEPNLPQRDYDHDENDYDNLPADEAKVDDTTYDEPDNALPNFARAGSPPHEKNAVGPNFNGTTVTMVKPGVLNDGKKPAGYSKSGRKLARSQSLSSSQSSDGESPKSYRKFKQNRGSSSKTKSSPFQKIKVAIGGMRSRSSSDASTTSYDPKPDDRALGDFSNFSPKPILKSTEHNASTGRLESPRSVRFEPASVDDAVETNVIKLSSSDEEPVQILPMVKEHPPQPPLEPVAPPIPPLHRLKEPLKDERVIKPHYPIPFHAKLSNKSGSSANKQNELSSSNLQTHSPLQPLPPPPSHPPPPPPPSHPPPDYIREPLNENSVKPPPMPVPYHIQKKQSLKGKNIPKSVPPPPSGPPPSDQPPPPPPPSHLPKPPLSLDLSQNNPSQVDNPLSPPIPTFKPPPPPISKEKQAELASNDSDRRRLPPPPSIPPSDTSMSTLSAPTKPHHVNSLPTNTKVPPPPPKRVDSIQSLASKVQEAANESRNNAVHRSPKMQNETLIFDAEFGGVEGQDRISSESPKITNGFGKQAKKLSKTMPDPTRPPDDVTEPLGDVQIVEPPPVSPLKRSSIKRDNLSNGVVEINGKPSVPEKPSVAKPMSMYMVKVLPTSPPLVLRGDDVNENNTEGTKEVDNESNTGDVQTKIAANSEEYDPRSVRTDSVSSVSSTSFPPLPPESLLSRVEESSDDANLDGEPQLIFHF